LTKDTAVRFPRKPPNLAASPQDAVGLFAHPGFRDLTATPMVNGKYVHWDKLRFHTPPDGLTHEQWWRALKIARQGGRRQVPLLDSSGNPFSYIVPDKAQEHLHEFSLGLGGQVQLPEPILNDDRRDQYYVSSLIEEAITSSQLEGAATTRKVAEDMLRTGRRPRDKGERMILNNYRMMKRISELQDQPLSPELVFELHRIVTLKTLDHDEQAGRLRSRNEDIVVEDRITGDILHQPPDATELPDRMQAMCKFANGETPEGWVHPLVRAIILHFWLAYDHPFVDGNGRTARALFYWSIQRAGLWLGEYISISNVIHKGPSKYVRAFLYTETDENDLTYFIMYHLDVIRQAVEHLHEYIAAKSRQVKLLQTSLRGMTELNHRQRELIAHALRHPRQEYTIQSHQHSHNVVYQTARTDLLDLEARGLLLKRKRGKAFVYTPAPDLQERLSA
jgi:Fic family protein